VLAFDHDLVNLNSSHGISEELLRQMFDRGVVVQEAKFGRIRAYGIADDGMLITAVLREDGGVWWLVTARKMEPREFAVFLERGSYGDEADE
jgi:hypothetical protein